MANTMGNDPSELMASLRATVEGVGLVISDEQLDRMADRVAEMQTTEGVPDIPIGELAEHVKNVQHDPRSKFEDDCDYCRQACLLGMWRP